MPRRRKRRTFKRSRKRRRTTRRRKRRRRNRGPSLRRMPLLFPDRLMVKLPYQGNIAFTSGIGEQFYRWNTNSLFDPENTGVGHQPLGFDQWKLFYAIYKVHACTVKIKMINNMPVNNVDVVFVWSPTTNIDTYVLTEEWQEQPYSTNYILPRQGSGSTKGFYKRHFHLSKIQGEKLNHQEYEAQTTASPAKLSFFYIWCKETFGASVTLDVEFNVRMTFFAEFYQRRPLVRS